MNSYIHLHKFHGSWVNPFMDQIVPHVCTLLLSDKKKKKTQVQLVFFSFEFKVSLVIYELRDFHDPLVKTLLFRNENLCLFLLSRNVDLLWKQYIHYQAWYTTFIYVMLYSVHHARGMDTIPCVNDKRSNKTNVKPNQVLRQCKRFYWQMQ